ncbi:MAG: type II toxin-antitoxin system RelE/ParE family toxin [Candidatus Rifleibacteriota bacterium]|jgi:putative addiction module killer protein
MYKIKHYLLENGLDPFEKWINSLKDRKARAKINVKIDRLSIGNSASSKPLGEGVIELKIDYGPGYRVYYGLSGKYVILLLCGGDKSTQQKDIETAKEYWTNFKRRSSL